MISMLSKFDHPLKVRYQVGFRDNGAYEKIETTQAIIVMRAPQTSTSIPSRASLWVSDVIRYACFAW